MTTQKLLTPAADEHAHLSQLVAQAPNAALALYDARSMTLLLCTPGYAAAIQHSGDAQLTTPIGGSWLDTAWWTAREQAAEQWQQALSSGAALRQPALSVTAADGSASVWDWSLTPIVDPQQPEQPRFLLVVAVDISAPTYARQQREYLDQLKDEFLLLASHELRTPLTSVVGYMHLLARLLAQPPSPEPARVERIARYVTTIQQQLSRLTRLVDDLADVGRLHSGKFTLARETVDLIEVLQRVAEEALMLTSQHKLLLDLPPDGPLLVCGDRARLIQVLMNLVQNAISYAPLSDRIELGLRREPDMPCLATIDVRDYGPGIAPQDLDALFDRFFQVARKQRSAHGGLGLGLFICKQIVEQHGGTITVESTLGRGTTFQIRLPLAEASKLAD